MNQALIQASKLTRDHPVARTRIFTPAPARRVLDNVDVRIDAGETVAIIGESGSGKSTLVRILLGLERASAGTVTFDGRDVVPGPARSLRWLRRRTGIVLQDPYSSLDPRMTVGGIIAEPLRALHVEGDHTRKVHDVLDRVGLSRERAGAYPHELSGGQRQRVAIARAIVHGPELLVGDEPMSALDVTIRASILELLAELHEDTGMGLILVSHDLGLVRHFADRVVVLKDGAVVEEGAVDLLFQAPAHPYTRQLIHAIPRLPAEGSSAGHDPTAAARRDTHSTPTST